MSDSLSISKGNVSINIRALEFWSMVKTVWVKGDRKDYYEARTDFWKIVKEVLREREKKEFDLARDSVSKLLQKSVDMQKAAKTAEAAFAIERLKKLEDFIQSIDKPVGVLMPLEDVKRNLFGLTKKTQQISPGKNWDRRMHAI